MRKGVAVWVFGFLAFLGVLHTFDATLSFTVGNVGSLLYLYPIGNVLESMDVVTYLCVSIVSTFIFFGVTCIVAFHDPLDILIQRILTNIEVEENSADETTASSLSALEMINSSLTSNSIALHAVKNDLKTVKTELRQLLKWSEKTKNPLERLSTCPTCLKQVANDFKLCPYCGDLLHAHVFIKSPLPEISQRKP